MRFSQLRCACALGALVVAGASHASETVTYTYDALGRLVTVAHSGTVNNGVSSTYQYDAADNRSNVTVTGVTATAVFAIGNASITEGGIATFTVTKTGSASGTVNFATSNGTAGASDFTANSGTLTFASADASKTISVQTTSDTSVEGNETFTVTLSNPSAGTSIGTATGTGTINDDDVSFSLAGNASATEGGNIVFTVNKTGTASGTLTVNYATTAGTATAGTDYTTTSNTLSFLATDTSKTISVPTTDDATVESAETFTMTLSAPSGGATLGTATATGTINDNDSTAFSIANATAVAEGGTLSYTVTKTGPAAANVSYATANGTASSGDYTSGSGTLNFLAGDTTKTVTVVTTNDTNTEANETVLVNLSAPTNGATISTSQGSGTINDNDPADFAIADATAVTEGGTLSYTVTKTGSGAASIGYATANGTASSGDYTSGSGTLTFGTGTSSQNVTVATTDDSTAESAETVLVNLSSASPGATVADTQGSGTINDNDTTPTTVSINDRQYEEGGSLWMDIVRSGPGVAFTVSYATSNGTATAGTDYTAASGQVSFTANDTMKRITVNSSDDSTPESDETFNFTLSSPTNGVTIADGTGVGTILDDDTVHISIDDASGIENASGGLDFDINRIGPNGSFDVHWATSNGTATAGNDYTTASGTASFNSATPSRTANVTLINNQTHENTETFNVTLSQPTNGAVIDDGTAVGTINDDD